MTIAPRTDFEIVRDLFIKLPCAIDEQRDNSQDVRLLIRLNGEPLRVEFFFCDGRLWYVQTRPDPEAIIQPKPKRTWYHKPVLLGLIVDAILGVMVLIAMAVHG
jgi:hypothetical protein